MAKFEIYFHGLICFWSNQPRDGDPKAPKREALFVIDDDHLRTVILPPDVRHFDNFKTIEIKVVGGENGDITADQQFLDHVPSLGDNRITESDMVINRDAALQLVLPAVAGKLRVAQRYRHKGIYKLKGAQHQRFVARITRLDLNAEQIFVKCDDEQPIEVPEDPGWVAILNVSPKPKRAAEEFVDGACENHFQRHHKIMLKKTGQPECKHVAVVEDDTQPLAQSEHGDHINEVKNLRELRPGIRVLTQTQCSNSNWP